MPKRAAGGQAPPPGHPPGSGVAARDQLHSIMDDLLDRFPPAEDALRELFLVLDTAGVEMLKALRGVTALASLGRMLGDAPEREEGKRRPKR